MYSEMKAEITAISSTIQDNKLRKMFTNCFYNTLDTALHYVDDTSAYILTGDIPAMWLRDSSASVLQYVRFAKKDKDVFKMLKMLLNREYFYIEVDPYCNSFNMLPNGDGHKEDLGFRTPYTWERKFELDSLCYPFYLLYKLYEETKDKSLLDEKFISASQVVMDVFETEMDHHKNSKYYHFRPNEAEEFCIPNKGYGGEVLPCGLIWSGYRPSDDACKYGYNIPGNMFAVVTLSHLEKLFNVIGLDLLAKRAGDLQAKIKKAIEKYGVIHTDKYGDIYAYEVDGLGNYLLMDDANIPSLLSIPCLGYEGNKKIYENTRKFILSDDNPYYFRGKILSGIGSPHTKNNYVWHMSVVMEGMTSNDNAEKINCLNLVLNSDGNTNLTHESVDINNDKLFTREWFTWSNSLFAGYILDNIKIFKGVKYENKQI